MPQDLPTPQRWAKRTLFQEEHDLLRKSVRDFIHQQVLPHYESWEEEGMVPREIWRQAGEQGLLCPQAMPQYGGLGGDYLHSIVVGEELYYHGTSSFFIPLHNDMVFPYLHKWATPAQAQRWIPGCISGETILAVAMTEPNVGTDLAQLKTSALRQSDHYVVNGQKTFISNGQLADLFIVAVRTNPQANPPHRGISLLAIPADLPGVTRGRNLAKIGLHAQDTSEIFFSDCRVPVDCLLGEEGKGFHYLMDGLQQERLTIAIGAIAAARGALEDTIKYVQNRQVFAAPLSQMQHTRFTLAEMATKIQMTQTFIDHLIGRHMDGEKLEREVSMAKWWATDLQFAVADNCLQMFGGYGYMKEYPISRHFIDARVQRIYGGANEIMKEVVARHILGEKN